MKFRHLCVLSFFSLSCAVPLNNLPRNVSHIPSTPACPHYCTNTAFNASLAEWYVCGDDRLGPVRLPSRLPLGGLFDTYDRFGGLCPGEFLQKWFDTTTGYYRYPTANGFQVDTAGSPIKGNVTLPVGLLIDRFGSEYGTYVSPEGAPYMQRALPPSNLDTPKDNFGCVNFVLMLKDWLTVCAQVSV